MVRMLSFGSNVPERNHFEALISHAIARRSLLANACRTNAYRLINSEGDFLPGLIVDYYDRHCVLQLLTLGMDKMRDVLVDILIKVLNPGSIYERSDHPVRKLEGLEHRAGQVYGTTPASVCIDEDSMIFSVDIRQGKNRFFHRPAGQPKSRTEPVLRIKSAEPFLIYGRVFRRRGAWRRP